MNMFTMAGFISVLEMAGIIILMTLVVALTIILLTVMVGIVVILVRTTITTLEDLKEKSNE